MNCQKSKFNLNHKFAFLNCAHMAPLTRKAEKAGREALAGKRRPQWIGPDDYFQDANTLRMLFSKLINSPDPSRIAVIPSAAYGIATVAKNIVLKKGENIIVAENQFTSNYYSWQKLCDQNNAQLIAVKAPITTESRGEKWNQDILNAINVQTKVVSIGHIFWADGTIFNLKAIREKCTSVGAALIIDGTQSIGALPFDLQEIKPDALIVAGYKWLLGPYSLGLAYYGEMFDNGEPLEEHWTNRVSTENFSGISDYRDEYRLGAMRYDMGEKSNFMLNPILIESLKQVIHWEPINIQAYCRNLVRNPIDKIRELGVYIEEDNARSSHIFGIQIPLEKIQQLKNAMKKNKVVASMRGDFLRVSPYVYTEARDMNKLVKTLKEVL